MVARIQNILAAHFNRKLAARLSPSPIVSFTFDDFPRSAWTVAGRMLADHGLHGTYYTARGLMGTTTPVGEMFGPADMESVVSAGHELACHTFNHALCSDLKPAALLGNCQRNRQRIAEELDGYSLVNFSFPEGVVTLGAKAALSSVYSTCRTIEPGINRGPVDFAFVRANRVYSRFGIERVKEMIAQNVEQRGWLVLYTHDVADRPSPYGCSPREFGQVLKCAVQSQADILSIVEATQRFQTVQAGT